MRLVRGAAYSTGGWRWEMPMKRFAVAIWLGAALLACITGSKAENLFRDVTSGRPDVVPIDAGPVRGYAATGVSSFLGIPYAAPPVGELRWKPPVAPASWDQPRDGGAFGSSCVQTVTYNDFAERSLSEDCLYLNVFAPASGRERPRPVMVWIHGGSLINGRGDDYDGRKLARDGNVVVVTLNYRLTFSAFSPIRRLMAKDTPPSITASWISSSRSNG